MTVLIDRAVEAMRSMDLDAERTGRMAEVLGDQAELHGVDVDEADHLLMMAGSLSRGRLLVRLWPAMRSRDWWGLLRTNWTCCDDLAAVADDMRDIINDASVPDLMLAMTPYERKVWRGLPETITVYRGCYDHNRDGLSWSLSRKVAERFTTLSRYHHADKTPLLLTGTVSKTSVFVKTDRKEREVVSPFVSEVAL